MGHRQEFEPTGPAEPWLSTPPQDSAAIWGVGALFLDQAPYLDSYRQKRARQKALLESFGPCLWLEITHWPIWHSLGRLVLKSFTMVQSIFQNTLV